MIFGRKKEPEAINGIVTKRLNEIVLATDYVSTSSEDDNSTITSIESEDARDDAPMAMIRIPSEFENSSFSPLQDVSYGSESTVSADKYKLNYSASFENYGDSKTTYGRQSDDDFVGHRLKKVSFSEEGPSVKEYEKDELYSAASFHSHADSIELALYVKSTVGSPVVRSLSSTIHQKSGHLRNQSKKRELVTPTSSHSRPTEAPVDCCDAVDKAQVDDIPEKKYAVHSLKSDDDKITTSLATYVPPRTPRSWVRKPSENGTAGESILQNKTKQVAKERTLNGLAKKATPAPSPVRPRDKAPGKLIPRQNPIQSKSKGNNAQSKSKPNFHHPSHKKQATPNSETKQAAKERTLDGKAKETMSAPVSVRPRDNASVKLMPHRNPIRSKSKGNSAKRKSKANFHHPSHKKEATPNSKPTAEKSTITREISMMPTPIAVVDKPKTEPEATAVAEDKETVPKTDDDFDPASYCCFCMEDTDDEAEHKDTPRDLVEHDEPKTTMEAEEKDMKAADATNTDTAPQTIGTESKHSSSFRFRRGKMTDTAVCDAVRKGTVETRDEATSKRGTAAADDSPTNGTKSWRGRLRSYKKSKTLSEENGAAAKSEDQRVSATDVPIVVTHLSDQVEVTLLPDMSHTLHGTENVTEEKQPVEPWLDYEIVLCHCGNPPATECYDDATLGEFSEFSTPGCARKAL